MSRDLTYEDSTEQNNLRLNLHSQNDLLLSLEANTWAARGWCREPYWCRLEPLDDGGFLDAFDSAQAVRQDVLVTQLPHKGILRMVYVIFFTVTI